MNRAEILTSEVVYLFPKPGGADEEKKNRFDYFMIDGAKAVFTLPKMADGRYFEILNGKEREFFEKELNVESLSFTMRTPEGKYYNPFWATFKVAVMKDESLMRNGRRFVMSDPIDNLSVRILKAYAGYPLREVAPSKEEAKLYPDARWYLTTEAAEEQSITTKHSKLAAAYIHFGQITNSTKKMVDFLRLYGSTFNKVDQIDINVTKPEQLIPRVQYIIENDIDGYLQVAEDTNIIAKVFIEDAVACKAIVKKDGEYRLKGGDALYPMDPSIDGMVQWYIDCQTNPTQIYTTIAAKVDEFRNKPLKNKS